MNVLLQILATLAGLAKTVFSFLRANKVRQEGVNAQVRVQEEQALDTLKEVHDAQVAAERDMRADPGRVLAEDDGFRRD